MFFSAKKFHYLPLSSSQASNKSNIYINPSIDIIPQSTDVPDLGNIMSKDCSFDSHFSSLSRKCNNLAGWILRSFVSRDKLTMLTLFKSLVISRLDYASQLWSPHKISQMTQIEKVQRSFTKHIAGLRDLSYHERLQTLKLLSSETSGVARGGICPRAPPGGGRQKPATEFFKIYIRRNFKNSEKNKMKM